MRQKERERERRVRWRDRWGGLPSPNLFIETLSIVVPIKHSRNEVWRLEVIRKDRKIECARMEMTVQYCCCPPGLVFCAFLMQVWSAESQWWSFSVNFILFQRDQINSVSSACKETDVLIACMHAHTSSTCSHIYISDTKQILDETGQRATVMHESSHTENLKGVEDNIGHS